MGAGFGASTSIDAALDAGAARVVLGTAAYKDLDFLDEALAAHPDRVVVSVDARGGKLAASGWTEQTDLPVAAVLSAMGNRGVRRFIYSSIERDGMLSGPDLDEVSAVGEAVRGSFIYSGGISTVEDLRALAALRQVNLSGVIVGKALYEGHLDVRAAQAALDG